MLLCPIKKLFFSLNKGNRKKNLRFHYTVRGWASLCGSYVLVLVCQAISFNHFYTTFDLKILSSLLVVDLLIQKQNLFEQ